MRGVLSDTAAAFKRSRSWR